VRTIRNFVFLLTCLFVLFLNIQLYRNIVYSSLLYLISLETLILLFILTDVIFGFQQSNRFSALIKELDKTKLALSDYALEMKLLTTIRDIMENFRSDLSLEEVLDKIIDSLTSHFHQETIIMQLFGENFVRVERGEKIKLAEEIVEDAVLKGHPVLVNNTGSFQEYEFYHQQGISSFLIAPLTHQNRTIGLIGIFSKKKRFFKPRDLELLRMVIAPTCLFIENTELFQKTKLLAITDSLTQLYNRRHFESIFSQVLTEMRQRNQPVALCICDIDYFKVYNDTNGHHLGDAALREIASILRKGVKGGDIVARWGGEEFVIILPQTSKVHALKICEDLRRKVQEYEFPNEDKQPQGDLTLSFGVACFPHDGTSADELLKKADHALYQAKGQGRNRVVAC